MDGSGRDCVFEAGETARSHRKVALSDSFRVRHGDEFAKLLGGGVVAENNPSDCRQHKYCDPDCGLWLGASPDEQSLGLFSATRSEEHTSELQSLRHLVCRLLL